MFLQILLENNTQILKFWFSINNYNYDQRIPPIWSSLKPYWAANCNLVLGVGCSICSSITTDVSVLSFALTKFDGSLMLFELFPFVIFSGAGIFDCGGCCWVAELLFSSLDNINYQIETQI